MGDLKQALNQKHGMSNLSDVLQVLKAVVNSDLKNMTIFKEIMSTVSKLVAEIEAQP